MHTSMMHSQVTGLDAEEVRGAAIIAGAGGESEMGGEGVGTGESEEEDDELKAVKCGGHYGGSVLRICFRRRSSIGRRNSVML